MQIRDATTDDAAGIAAIYNDAVTNTTAIWNETVVDVQNRIDWILDRQAADYPVLVAVDSSVDAEDSGAKDTGAQRVLGYASYGPFRPQDGFRHTVEHSVYVRADQRGAGVGSALLRALIERARTSGVHVIVAGIDASNLGSIALHERLGFTRVGLLPEVGTKFGSWLDLAFLQLILPTDDRDTGH